MRWTPRLRTVLFAVNLVLLLIPLGGVVLLRLYESALIRRTEAELIAQGAHVASIFQVEVERELDRRAAVGDDRRRSYGAPAELDASASSSSKAFTPRLAQLDLATHAVRPPPGDALEPESPPDAVASKAGERITAALRAAQKTTLAGIRVVDFRGTVVATTRTEGGLSLVHREEVARALRGEPVSLMRERYSDEPPPALDSLSRSTALRVFVAMPVVQENRIWGAVVLSRTPMNVAKSLYYIRWHIAGWSVALLLAIGLLSLLTSWTVTGPMKELIAQTERVARGQKGAARSLERPGTHEVKQVSEAIARMAASLEERAEYIDAFASSVSHEFKTPLTSIRGAVELLREHFDSMTPAERAGFLDNLEQDAERLDRLVSRLTDLARADVFKPGEETVRVKPVLEAISSRYRDMGLDIELRQPADDLEVVVGREPFETIVVNLVDNALQHGGEDVHVVVVAEAAGGGGREGVMVSVIDDGPGISEGNERRIFDRFFTTARDKGGSGLGLSIVKTLVDAHGGSVSLSSENGETVAALSLPAPAREARSSRAPG